MLKPVSIKCLILLLGSLLVVTSCAPTGIYHTVQPGQTLYRIARTYEIDEDRLASINNINDPTQLKVKQRLYIPGVTQLRNVPATSVSASKPKQTAKAPTTRAPAKSYKKQPTKTRKSTTKQQVTTRSTVAKPVKGIFSWPARGKILSKFGKRGQKVYKGIEISVAQGTPVLAAASGKVIYSGNAIAGYGNLVILEHSDSFFSVYGYNQKYLVKMDDHVAQGEKIALSGIPPSGQRPSLYFEIRKGKSAVNPILYLP
jgi:lipoprotein NlpD